MKIKDLFENRGITGLRLKTGFLEMEWNPEPEEQQAAWELYIELLTRIATQPLTDGAGDEASALKSVRSLFQLTRELLREKGRKAETFSKVAIVILNQKIRPFTARWHRPSIEGAFGDPARCRQFRTELRELQQVLRGYASLLAEVAGVEDFQDLVQTPLEPV